MLVSEYKRDYDKASLNLEDFAYAASTVVDYGRLSFAANQFIAAKASFEAELARVNVELG